MVGNMVKEKRKPMVAQARPRHREMLKNVGKRKGEGGRNVREAMRRVTKGEKDREGRMVSTHLAHLPRCATPSPLRAPSSSLPLPVRSSSRTQTRPPSFVH